MTSSIDDTKPTASTALTADVRSNFSHAEDEINALLHMSEDSVTCTGTADAMTATFSIQPVLADTPRILVTAPASTSTVTTPSITVNDTLSSGAKTIVNKDGSALVVGDITSGIVMDLVYNGTDWVWMNGNDLQAALDTAEADIATLQAVVTVFPHDFIGGMEFSASTDNLTVAAGSCVDSTNTYKINISSAITKDLGTTWAAGTGNGGRGASVASLVADTRYKIYGLSQDGDDSQYDVILSTSEAQAITDASGNWDVSRHIGYVRIDAAGTAIRDEWRISNPADSKQLLDQWTANADASVDFTNDIDSTYDNYLVSFTAAVPATTANDLAVRCGNGAFDSGASDYRVSIQLVNTGQAPNVGTGSSFVLGGSTTLSSTATHGGQSGEITIHNPSNSNHTLFNFFANAGISATNVMHSTGSAKHNKAAAMDQIQFLMNPSVGGNITSGVFKLYGLK